jgi:hypothetical protein
MRRLCFYLQALSASKSQRTCPVLWIEWKSAEDAEAFSSVIKDADTLLQLIRAQSDAPTPTLDFWASMISRFAGEKTSVRF